MDNVVELGYVEKHGAVWNGITGTMDRDCYYLSFQYHKC